MPYQIAPFSITLSTLQDKVSPTANLLNAISRAVAAAAVTLDLFAIEKFFVN